MCVYLSVTTKSATYLIYTRKARSLRILYGVLKVFVMWLWWRGRNHNCCCSQTRALQSLHEMQVQSRTHCIQPRSVHKWWLPHSSAFNIHPSMYCPRYHPTGKGGGFDRSRSDRSVELHGNAFREDDVDNTWIKLMNLWSCRRVRRVCPTQATMVPCSCSSYTVVQLQSGFA